MHLSKLMETFKAFWQRTSPGPGMRLHPGLSTFLFQAERDIPGAVPETPDTGAQGVSPCSPRCLMPRTLVRTLLGFLLGGVSERNGGSLLYLLLLLSYLLVPICWFTLPRVPADISPIRRVLSPEEILSQDSTAK